MLATSGTCTTDQLAGKVPEESARYHLFRFKHTHQGDYKESNGECRVEFPELQEYISQFSFTPCRDTPCLSRRG